MEDFEPILHTVGHFVLHTVVHVITSWITGS